MAEEQLTDAAFRSRMASIPFSPGPHPPHSWQANLVSIHDRAAKGDLSSILRWPVIHGTMWVGNCKRTKEQYTWLTINHPDLLSAALPASLPTPEPPLPSGHDPNLITQLYHLCQHPFAVSLSSLSSITEFGGGYGAMALVCSRLGFTGTYHLYDLPELLLIQEYFLSRQNIHGALSYGTSITPSDLFIACYSLSEAPLTARHVANNHHAYLIASENDWFAPNYRTQFIAANQHLAWTMKGAYSIGL